MTKNVQTFIVCALLFASSFTFSRLLTAQESQPSPNASSLSSGGRSSTTAAQASSIPSTQEVSSLKKQVISQQQQIEHLRSTLAKQQELLERLVQSGQSAHVSHAAPKPTSTATATPAKPQPRVASAEAPEPAGHKQAGKPDGTDDTHGPHGMVASAVPPSVATDSVPATPLPSGLNSDQGQNPAIPNAPIAPIPLKIGNAVITPVGFVDATEFFRTENLGSGIGGAFGSIPFSNTVAGQLTENRFTIQNSRIGMEMDDQFGANKVRGYLETDFLGAQPTNAFVTSNSDSLRIRLYWVDLTHGKFEFLAGQSWSLLTPGRTGISPMPSDIFYSQDMDTNYQVGLTWSRQLQFRFVYHASPSVTAALSLEDADQYVGSAVVLPTGFSSSQVDTGASTSTPNVFPDVIGKIAFDPHVAGKDLHFEFAGLLSAFKTYNSTLNSTSTVAGGGGSFNFNLELFKNFHLVESSFYSSGGGRYIFGLGPDFIVRPDGTPSLVQADSGVGGFEYQFIPQTMLYGYYGGAYYGRDYGLIPSATGGAPTYVGYGFPGSSSSVNRSIQEGTFGIIQTFWKNPHYGALQLITQYSYLTRAPWFVAPGSPKNAHLSEAYADIRYVLP